MRMTRHHPRTRFIPSLIRVLLPVLALLLPLTPQAADPHIVRLATTTSTENSGLLAALLPAFKKETGYEVQVIAVGTGKALRMGQDGDVDVVLTHAPAAEDNFVAEGHGVNRRSVMYNDFVIVGPEQDPAGVRGLRDASAALAHIMEKGAVFVSRGDDSGTHKKELELWKSVGARPDGAWYREAGQGMEEVLIMSGELSGYTLTDRGTWLAIKDKLPLELLVEGDERLFNPYSIIAVNPARYPDANYMGAMALIAWITSPQGQDQIRGFKIAGDPLFTPTAIQRAATEKRMAADK